MKLPDETLRNSLILEKKPFRIAAIFFAGLIIFLTALIFSAWCLNVAESFPLHFDAINPTAALCLLLISVSAMFFSFRPSRIKWKLICKVVAVIVIIQGAARIAEAMGMHDLKMDMWLLHDRFGLTPDGEIKGRMTFLTSLIFVLFGIIFFLKLSTPKKFVIIQLLLLVILVISFFNIISVIYGVRNEYFGQSAMYKMRMGASISCLLIALIFLAQDSKRGMMAVIMSAEPGGKIIRAFIPVVILFPVFLGLIDRISESTGLYQDAFGLALSSIAIIIMFFVILFRTARSNNKTYRQLLSETKKRIEAGKQAQDSEVFANTIYENIPHMVFVKDAKDLKFKSINRAGEKLISRTNEEVVGKCDYDFFPKEEADFFRERDMEVFSSDEPIIVEEPISTPRYGQRWLRTKKIGVRDEKGRPIYMIGISEDITELKEKQEQFNRYNTELEKEIEARTSELKKSEERYQKMIEDVQDYSILLLDPDGIILNWNKGAERMNGYKAEEVIGKSFKIFYSEEARRKETGDLLLAEARKNGRASSEGWRVKKDGSTLWAYVSLTALFDDSGNITGFSKLTRDVTEKKLAEQKLIESERQFQAFMGTLPAMAWIVDEQGVFKYTNSLYNHVFNNTNLIGKNFHDFFPKEIALEYQQNNDIVFKSNIPLETIEPSIKPDGSTAILKIFKFPLGVSKGSKLLGGIAVDITQMINTEEALKQANEQISLFVKHTPAAVAMFDENMRYIVASDRWYSDYGLKGQEIIGKSHYEIFPEINNMPEWKEIHNRCLKGAIEIREKDLFPRSDGSFDWLRWEIHPWKTGEDKISGIMMFTEVITDRIKAEEELTELNEQLIASNKELEQFAYVASHDLQEPLRMVSSFLQLLEKKYKNQIDEKANQYIGFAVDGAERMKILINDLLKFSRLGTYREEEVEVDCNNIVEETLKLYQHTIREAKVLINVSSLPVIKARKIQIEQLFQNLISNALKYRKDTAPVINISCTDKENSWQFAIRDNGIGIDPKYFDKIFVIFQRLHGKKDYSGTGIGLAICKKIVEQWGGEIWVESVEGEGSVFKFTFPKNN